MAIAIVTGSGGLIGSESVAQFVRAGFQVIGIENNLRAYFFGDSASTAPATERLVDEFGGSFQSLEIDIRDRDAVNRVFALHAAEDRAGNPHSGPTVA
jgi:CDP-paratose 2-epimerase